MESYSKLTWKLNELALFNSAQGVGVGKGSECLGGGNVFTF